MISTLTEEKLATGHAFFFFLPSFVLRPVVWIYWIYMVQPFAKRWRLLCSTDAYCGKMSLWAIVNAAPWASWLPFVLLLLPRTAPPPLAPFILWLWVDVSSCMSPRTQILSFYFVFFFPAAFTLLLFVLKNG